jgi:MYXO-CTERM domain-containing protein
MYIGNVARFTLRYSYSHDSKIGHLVKSRAAENYILYNRLTGESGTSSYELDLPNAGKSVVLGNLIEQGPNTDNASILTYGLEGTTPGNPGHDLYVVNNTFVNDRPNGGTFVNVGAMIDTPALLENNVFSGPGTITNQVSAVLTTNFSGGDAMLVNAASFDYHLKPGSPCANDGTAPGMAGDFALSPVWQYVHPTNAEGRMGVGTIDIGAYELNGGNGTSPGGASGVVGAGGSPSTSASGGASNTNGGASTNGGTASTTGGAPSAQAGSTASQSSDSSGCGCRTSAPGGTRQWLALFALGVVVLRRRIRGQSSAH